MNERDKEIREKAWALVSDEERERKELYETRERWERCDQKFAALIRADAMEAATRAANVSWSLVCKKMVELEREAAEERVVDLFADMETPYLPDIIRAIRARSQP